MYVTYQVFVLKVRNACEESVSNLSALERL
jgi:hypothetical protein